MSSNLNPDTSKNSAADALDLAAFRPRVLNVAYFVADIERALAFYVGVLGLKEVMRLPLGDGVQEAVLNYPDAPGTGVILMWKDGDTSPRSHGNGYSRLVLRVSDVEGALQLLVKHGAPVIAQPATMGSLKYAMVSDPDGYVVELLEFVKT